MGGANLQNSRIPSINVPVLDERGAPTLPWFKSWQATAAVALNAATIIPGNAQAGSSYILETTDAGGSIDHTAPSALTITIPLNVLTLNATVEIDNGGASAGVVNIMPATGVTLIWASSGVTGERFLGAAGWASMRQTSLNVWKIHGDGLS